MLILLNITASAATIKQLRAGLSNLPAPKNDFEIVLPNMEMEEDKGDDMEGIEEDASDRDKKIKAQLEEEGCNLNFSIIAF
jgi:hypothetical protein